MTFKFSTLVATTSLLIFCSASAAALADGMPFEEPAKPQQNLTPIDKTLTPAPAQQGSLTAPPAAAPAPEATPPVPESRIVDVQPNSSFFGLSVGEYDPFTHSGKSTAFNAEWQPGVKIVGYLQPLFGGMVTTKGSLLGYGGLGVPFNLTDHVFLMPSVAVGAYKHNGSDFNLGRSVVERVGTELAYQFDDKSRLGLNFDVLTNGKSLQPQDRTEIVALTYTMPFNAFSASTTEPAPAAAVAPTPTAAPAATTAAPAPAAATPAPAPAAAAPASPTPAPSPAPAPTPAQKPPQHELP